MMFLATKLAGRTGSPAFQRQLRHDQHLTVLVDAALDQAQHAAHGPLDAFDGHGLLPQGYTLARARRLPVGGAIGIKARGDRGHVGRARVPLVFSTERGFQMAHWSRAGMSHWVISDVNREEFSTVVRSIEVARSEP